MARMSSATSTKNADPTGALRRSRPNRTPGGRRRAGMLSRRLYDGVGESLDHRGARTLLRSQAGEPRASIERHAASENPLRAITVNDFAKLGTARGGTPTIVERLPSHARTS